MLALVATLAYSRASYAKFVACSGEDVATLCTGLREAFDYFGGVPEHVLFDYTKAVVIELALTARVNIAGTPNCANLRRAAASSLGCAAPSRQDG